MGRALNPYTRIQPYIASWTAAGLNTASTAANSPVILPGLTSAAYVQFSVAGIAAGPLTLTWQLLLIHEPSVDLSGNSAPVRCIVFTTTPTARRTDAVGTGEYYFHDDKIIDIGGFGGVTNAMHWELALADISTETGVRLYSWGPARLQGSP